MALTQYVNALAVGTTVNDITGSISDGAKAGGYAAWIESVTGATPKIVRLDNNRVRLVLNQTQIKTMQQWLDSMITGAFKSKKPPTVEYELGPVLKPWVIKRAAPVSIGLFLAGAALMYTLIRV